MTIDGRWWRDKNIGDKLKKHLGLFCTRISSLSGLVQILSLNLTFSLRTNHQIEKFNIWIWGRHKYLVHSELIGTCSKKQKAINVFPVATWMLEIFITLEICRWLMILAQSTFNWCKKGKIQICRLKWAMHRVETLEES